MIRHIVMWRVSGETAEERLAAQRLVKESFEGLRGQIPGMHHIEVGIDFSAVDYACDAVLVADFASRTELNAYGSHPEHLRVRERLGGVRTARFQVDYHVDSGVAVKATAEPTHAKP